MFNENDELLMIYRNKKWDLPKGKREVNESKINCAFREVIEESGIKDLSLKRFLKNTYHTYELNGESILKITSWFLMYSNFKGIFLPQASEGIEDVQWIKKYNLVKYSKNTYANIAEILLEL